MGKSGRDLKEEGKAKGKSKRPRERKVKGK